VVEAAGQRFHPFRDGLDYAFIPVARDAGRVIRLVKARILVRARLCSSARL
jgi:hypothetical protein